MVICIKASGEKIREARKAANLTQAQLGEKMHVSGSMVGQYETEARRPSIKTAKEIATILGIDARTLFVEFEADDLTIVPAATTKLVEIERSKVEVIPADLHNSLFATLTPKERIVTALESLNPGGQQEAAKRVEELTEIPRYCRQDAPQLTPASLEDTNITPTTEGAETPPEGE